MTREKYNSVRYKFIRFSGFFLLIIGLLTAIYCGITVKLANDRSTAIAVGEVTGEKYVTEDNGKKVRKMEITYDLPDGHWVVYFPGDLAIGSKLNVYYNPDDPQEKYIEGYKESPLSYVLLGFSGAAMGAVLLAVTHFAKKKAVVNDILDIVDDNIR